MKQKNNLKKSRKYTQGYKKNKYKKNYRKKSKKKSNTHIGGSNIIHFNTLNLRKNLLQKLEIYKKL